MFLRIGPWRALVAYACGIALAACLVPAAQASDGCAQDRACASFKRERSYAVAVAALKDLAEVSADFEAAAYVEVVAKSDERDLVLHATDRIARLRIAVEVLSAAGVVPAEARATCASIERLASDWRGVSGARVAYRSAILGGTIGRDGQASPEAKPVELAYLKSREVFATTIKAIRGCIAHVQGRMISATAP